MDIDRIFRLFDALITPVATYGSPLWLPYIMPKKNTRNESSLLDYCEVFKCEMLQQKCARIILSVSKTTSRLSLLGEIGRFPLFIQSLSHCLSYKMSLNSRRSSNNLINCLMTEMNSLASSGNDSWLTRVQNIENILKIPQNINFSKQVGKRISSLLKSKYDKYYLNKINEINFTDPDMREYKTMKGSFTMETYLTLVRNRNQRKFLSRIRVGSHNLRVEQGRHT